jgi:hypothetical protein
MKLIRRLLSRFFSSKADAPRLVEAPRPPRRRMTRVRCRFFGSEPAKPLPEPRLTFEQWQDFFRQTREDYLPPKNP